MAKPRRPKLRIENPYYLQVSRTLKPETVTILFGENNAKEIIGSIDITEALRVNMPELKLDGCNIVIDFNKYYKIACLEIQRY